MRFLVIFFISISSLIHALEYNVQIEGILPEKILNLIEASSQLITLKDKPPATTAGLKYRAEADIDTILTVLYSQALYGASVTLDYNFNLPAPLVIVKIETGPVYPLADFKIISQAPFDFSSICLEDLGINLGSPAYPKTIVEAEEALLFLLEHAGYPLAIIERREVIADQKLAQVQVKLYVDSGPEATFGTTSVVGNQSVKEAFFFKKLAWQAGARFDPCKVEKTQNAIEASGLFSSIAIEHAATVDENGTLPMRIEVIESKQRSIGFGLAYATQRGPGLRGEWEHRNFLGMGERLHLDTDLWHDQQELHILYVKPDFLQREQDLLILTEASHMTTRGYTESSFSFSETLERPYNEQTRISYGWMYKWLHDTRSDVNGIYNLLKLPLQLKWSNANNILDPTEGYSLNLKIVPTLQFLHPQFAYCINTMTVTSYLPLSEDHRYVLASKISLGSIWGSSRRTIPSSERFYEGSENCLRGYHYQTVSPLRECDKPIGGRSLMLYSFELRVRATDSFGWVAFYDFGNVYREILPQFDQKILQSVGFGLRYHTPVGPVRLDFAVPLNRRPKLDKRFQIYLSIGQAF